MLLGWENTFRSIPEGQVSFRQKGCGLPLAGPFFYTYPQFVVAWLWPNSQHCVFDRIWNLTCSFERLLKTRQVNLQSGKLILRSGSLVLVPETWVQIGLGCRVIYDSVSGVHLPTFKGCSAENMPTGHSTDWHTVYPCLPFLRLREEHRSPSAFPSGIRFWQTLWETRVKLRAKQLDLCIPNIFKLLNPWQSCNTACIWTTILNFIQEGTDAPGGSLCTYFSMLFIRDHGSSGTSNYFHSGTSV